MSLLFAILSNRTLLIQMKGPFDIERLLHPNVIKWNQTDWMNINNSTKRDFNLINKPALDANWASFSKEVFNHDIDIITFHTNLGTSWYYEVFDDKWIKMFSDQLNVTKENDILIYGCASRYLFTYDKIVTDAIKKETEELGLIPGLYVSAHYRSYFMKLSNARSFLNRSIEVANQMSNDLNKTFKVYFITDSPEVEKIADTEYYGQIMTGHVKKVHIDEGREFFYEGFIGVLVNVEVAAKGVIFVRSPTASTFSDLIQSVGQFNEDAVITPNVYLLPLYK